jgi:hypothetical protein
MEAKNNFVLKIEEEDIDGYYEDASDDTDEDNKWLLLAALLLGTAAVQLADKGGITNEAFADVMGMDASKLNIEIPEDDLATYQNMQQELKQHGRLEDPKSVENTSMKWAENQSDAMGMFGDIEAYKSGSLDVYAMAAEFGAEVRLPWNPTGPNTCDDCMAKVDEGPYLPEEFPEPVHYGDQCNDPMAEPVIIFKTGEGAIPME